MDTIQQILLRLDSADRRADTLKYLLNDLSKKFPDSVEPATSDWLLIFIAAGLIGGITAYFFPSNENPPVPKLKIYAYLLFGLVASFSVPAFLYLVRSEFLKDAALYKTAMWAMFGLALIVAVFGQQFILKMWNIINEMKSLNTRQAEILNRLEETEKKFINNKN